MFCVRLSPIHKICEPSSQSFRGIVSVRLTCCNKICEPSSHSFHKISVPSPHSFRGIVSVCLTCCHKICEPSSHSFHGIRERSPNSFRRIVSVRLICFHEICEPSLHSFTLNLWAFVSLLTSTPFHEICGSISGSFSLNWNVSTLLICLNHNMILLCMRGGGVEITFYHWSAIRFWSEQVHLDWRITIYDKVLLILLSWWCKH